MSKPDSPRAHRVLHGLILTWIVGVSLFFFLRFSLAFYFANAAAIARALGSLTPW